MQPACRVNISVQPRPTPASIHRQTLSTLDSLPSPPRSLNMWHVPVSTKQLKVPVFSLSHRCFG